MSLSILVNEKKWPYKGDDIKGKSELSRIDRAAIRELNHPLVLADVELPQQLLYGQVLVVFITVECARCQIEGESRINFCRIY